MILKDCTVTIYCNVRHTMTRIHLTLVMHAGNVVMQAQTL